MMEHNGLTAADLNGYWEGAMTMEAYWEDLFDEGPRPEGPYDAYLKINRARAARVRKSVVIAPELAVRAAEARAGTRWLVVTEHWCGDSAQVLPVLDALAQASGGRIDVRVVFRDQDVRLIDAFLTNGGRSIPKVIALDAAGEVIATWGPRPAAAMDLVKTLKANPETAPHYAEHLHKWYAQDRQHAIQHEALGVLLQA